ncbi:hypothetical protein [Nitrosomonas halophila]|uniref:Cell division protein ZapB n=1 Tax=Nitrosomonas halophila TaxID=44576 RepID=A0A1H3KUS0_9PROT|nr:hypothetical protein [Nitrosomonas halophila]SDY55871.1 cell division protein ZapB [Nitrosomonas halophila]
MDAELKLLEEKIDQLVRLYQDARQENSRLCQLLENAEAANHQLAKRMGTAAGRLQALLNNLPEN